MQRVLPKLSGLTNIAVNSTFNLQQARTTVVFKRRWAPPLAKLKGPPRKLRERHQVYQIIDVVHMRKPPKLEVILTDYVEGLGIRGDHVFIDRVLARRKLLPTGLAVYASPENVSDFEKEIQEKGLETERKTLRLTTNAIKTLKELELKKLYVPMNKNNDWVLTKKHLRIAFRYSGVVVPEECITLPDDEITRETADLPFKISVTVNGLETTWVDAHIFLIDNDDAEATGKSIPTHAEKTRDKLNEFS